MVVSVRRWPGCRTRFRLDEMSWRWSAPSITAFTISTSSRARSDHRVRLNPARPGTGHEIIPVGFIAIITAADVAGCQH